MHHQNLQKRNSFVVLNVGCHFQLTRKWKLIFWKFMISFSFLVTYLKKCRCKIWCLLICTFSKELVALGYVHFHFVCHDFYKITPHTTYFSGENIFLYIRPVINQADSWGLRHPPSPSLPHSCSPSPDGSFLNLRQPKRSTSEPPFWPGRSTS